MSGDHRFPLPSAPVSDVTSVTMEKIETMRISFCVELVLFASIFVSGCSGTQIITKNYQPRIGMTGSQAVDVIQKSIQVGLKYHEVGEKHYIVDTNKISYTGFKCPRNLLKKESKEIHIEGNRTMLVGREFIDQKDPTRLVIYKIITLDSKVYNVIEEYKINPVIEVEFVKVRKISKIYAGSSYNSSYDTFNFYYDTCENSKVIMSTQAYTSEADNLISALLTLCPNIE